MRDAPRIRIVGEGKLKEQDAFGFLEPHQPPLKRRQSALEIGRARENRPSRRQGIHAIEYFEDGRVDLAAARPIACRLRRFIAEQA